MDAELPKVAVRQIVSGGQTGVDRGALDSAIAVGIDHGGWCPRGRRTETGPLPARYALRETEETRYWVRTERNVLDSDGTLILYRGALSGGTKLTYRFTRKHARPAMLVNLEEASSVAAIRRWLAEEQIEVLNVAGPRESTAAGIADQARLLLEAVFASQ